MEDKALIRLCEYRGKDLVESAKDDEKIIDIYRGIIGSGRNSASRHEAEDILEGGIDNKCYCKAYNNEGELKQQHEQNLVDVESCMKAGETRIIVDNTNITPDEMMPYIHRAKEYGYRIIIHDKGLPTSENLPPEVDEKDFICQKIYDRLNDEIKKSVSLETITNQYVNYKNSTPLSEPAFNQAKRIFLKKYLNDNPEKEDLCKKLYDGPTNIEIDQIRGYTIRYSELDAALEESREFARQVDALGELFEFVGRPIYSLTDECGQESTAPTDVFEIGDLIEKCNSGEFDGEEPGEPDKIYDIGDSGTLVESGFEASTQLLETPEAEDTSVLQNMNRDYTERLDAAYREFADRNLSYYDFWSLPKDEFLSREAVDPWGHQKLSDNNSADAATE